MDKQELDTIVGNALMELSKCFPKLATNLIQGKDDSFITWVEVNTGEEEQINGVYHPAPTERYLIYDTLQKRTNNPDIFLQQTQDVVYLFHNIDKWYNC